MSSVLLAFGYACVGLFAFAGFVTIFLGAVRINDYLDERKRKRKETTSG